MKNRFFCIPVDSMRSFKALPEQAVLLGLFIYFFLPTAASGGEPDLKTPEPVIYLADNLDEKDRLGWCIDTVGRGFSDRLHAHSCKPRGGDVQFYYNKKTHQIVSATYEEKCAALAQPAAAGISLGLLDCSAASAQQLFTYHTDASEFRPKSNSTLCLAVGKTSRTAGPFMSRDLILEDCESTEAEYKQWNIKDSQSDSRQ